MHPQSIVCTTSLIALLWSTSSAEQVGPYALNVWFRSPQYVGCRGDFLDFGKFACENVDSRTYDYGTAPNFAWIILSGVPAGNSPDVEGVGGLQFGLHYPESVDMSGWHLCTGGAEIPQDGWPASGTGNAMTFTRGCVEADNESGFVKVAYMTVRPGSKGVIGFIPDPRIDDLIAADCSPEAYQFCGEQLGTGETDPGGEPGYVACGVMCAVPVRESTWGQLKSAFGR